MGTPLPATGGGRRHLEQLLNGVLVVSRTPQVGRADGLPGCQPFAAQKAHAGAHVALVGATGQVRQAALDAAVVQEIGQLSFHQTLLGQPQESDLAPYAYFPAYRPATEKPRRRGFSIPRMIRELDETEIDDFLREQVVGRIGMHAHGETYVVPVIYAWDGECIYVQTIEGRKIEMMRANPRVCFETDVYDAGSWRSVIVDGTYEELHGDDAQRALDVLVARFSAGPRRERPRSERTPVAFRIRPHTLSGRSVTRS